MTWKTGNADEFLEDTMDDKMTEHVHEWELTFKPDSFRRVRCKHCPEQMLDFEIEQRLNATERLSALITDLVANASDGVNDMGGPFVALSVIARILEGKDG